LADAKEPSRYRARVRNRCLCRAAPRPGDTKRILGPENIFDTAYRDASTFANVSYPQSLTNPLLEVAGTSP